ncbi:hypothetical protein ALI144C_27590 [Actinosynnema sp. ALI-1.44]|uniref:GDSL-type esterase/lipase family protein n=1 Tax=Actinosynnema sp. ALI-1.44 TaxID=1933779 RepID=UPI00097C6990|nr:GDSL-type esterase/lipase family protein [Actinosynnema sp. ALI-1.44]ONI78585.1 hypothetical protein ALI144C_27590 [Actinosynnema sp. ALI-1.44]
MIRALAAAVLLLAMIPGNAVAEQPRGRAWLALGDSYSSGEGIFNTPPAFSTQFDKECMRAHGNGVQQTAWGAGAYQQVRDKFGMTTQRFVACTGAIIDDVPKELAEARESEQAEGTGRTKWDVVSFSFGGNNIKFSEVIFGCLNFRLESWQGYKPTGCVETEEQMRRRVDMLVGQTPIVASEYAGQKTLPSLFDDLVDVVVPGGDVVVLGYPNVIEDPARWSRFRKFCAGVKKSDVPMLRNTGSYLNEQIRNAVAAANFRHPGIKFHFIDIAHNPYELDDKPENRHARCTKEDWINGVQFDVGQSGHKYYMNRSFHPNQKGHTATAAVVANHVRDNVTFDDVPRTDPNSVVAAYLTESEQLNLVTGDGRTQPLPGIRASRGSSVVAFSRDGKWLGVNNAKQITFVNTANPAQRRTVSCDCWGIAFDGDNHAASLSRKGEIVVYDPAKGDQPIRTVSLDSEIDRDHESRAAQVVLVAAGAGTYVLKEPESGRLLVADSSGAMMNVTNTDPPDYPGLVAVSADGTRIAYATGNDCGQKGPKITVIRDISFVPPVSHRSSVYNPDGDSARGTFSSLAFDGDSLLAGWSTNATGEYGACGTRGAGGVWLTSVPAPGSESQPGSWFQVRKDAGHAYRGLYTTPTSQTKDQWDLTDGTRTLGRNAVEIWFRP